MSKKLGILFTSRNNYELLDNWMNKVDTENFSVLTIDEDSIEKNKEIGKATSIVWSPKYSKYIGFLIANKDIKEKIEDYSIFENVKFTISEIV